jgi:CBS domain-containing protein
MPCDPDAIAAAGPILDEGLWCVLEVCLDVPAQRWEPRLIVFQRDAHEVAAAVSAWIAQEPGSDVRLSGCDRSSLRPEPGVPPRLCYVAATPAPAAAPPPPRRTGRTPQRRIAVQVLEGMNPVVVTVGPSHTLREAARRMTARGVGAAVVFDSDQPGPGIITERDILHSNGVGQDIDVEVVGDHLTSQLVYAAADWSLERAAEEMVRGGFRHVIVLDGSEVVGILSMRDIVRCWTSAGAACDLGQDTGEGRAAGAPL